MIIGVCGTFASGKDTVAEYIESKGFTHVSSGDAIRQYVRDNNLGGLDRDNLRLVANETRAEKGGDFFIRHAIASSPRPLVLSGLRSPLEIEAVKKEGGIIIGVDAPVTQRYQWAKDRGRIDDGITEAKFKGQEQAEETNQKTGQQITVVMGMADYDIANDGTLEELYTKVDEVLARLTPEGADK
jgi:dephospho-CoA kinase